MKYSCEMIKDLLPLYCDGACSSESRKTVEEHLEECESCRNMLQKMQDSTYDDRLRKERDEVILHHTKSVKRKTLIVGLGVMLIPIVICFIVNLATTHTLDWFFIVLTAIMVFASLTVVPLAVIRKKGLWTLVTFTISLISLLMTCCLYSGGDWFWVACIAILFGLAVVFLPFAVYQLPLKGFASHHKGFLVMAVDTVLLYLLVMVCGVYGGSADYWKDAFLITTMTAAFAWILFAVIRYFRCNGFIRAGIGTILTGIFSATCDDVIRQILDGVWHLSLLDANLFRWNTDKLINANCYLLILLTGFVIGVILLVIGVVRKGTTDRN